jgi:hypothetical protein
MNTLSPADPLETLSVIMSYALLPLCAAVFLLDQSINLGVTVPRQHITQ